VSGAVKCNKLLGKLSVTESEEMVIGQTGFASPPTEVVVVITATAKLCPILVRSGRMKLLLPWTDPCGVFFHSCTCLIY